MKIPVHKFYFHFIRNHLKRQIDVLLEIFLYIHFSIWKEPSSETFQIREYLSELKDVTPTCVTNDNRVLVLCNIRARRAPFHFKHVYISIFTQPRAICSVIVFSFHKGIFSALQHIILTSTAQVDIVPGKLSQYFTNVFVE